MLPSELLEKGWCQHVEWDKDLEGRQRYCFGGAIKEAGIRRGEWIAIVNSIVGLSEEYVSYTMPNGETSIVAGIPRWNDHPDRTQAEVAALAKLVEIKMGLRVEGADWAEEGLEVGVIELVERELVGSPA